MRRLPIAVLLFALVAFAPAAHAAPAPAFFAKMARQATRNIVVPLEWDGTYAIVDSIYTCDSTFVAFTTFGDTLCGGQPFVPPSSDTTFALQCTGTITATTIDLDCTSSGPIVPDCDANYHMVMHGTMAPGLYHVVSTITITYSGNGVGCDNFPPYCGQVDTWGVRTGPAPTDYCTTPARRTTWGRVKSYYR